MNANELADKCDEVFVLVEYDAIKQAATMLRQQQAEIEALKQRCAFLEDQAIMIEPEEMQQSYVYKYLFGDDMLEANRKINNMLRQMVDELPLKDKP